jgi:hypothetical protein
VIPLQRNNHTVDGGELEMWLIDLLEEDTSSIEQHSKKLMQVATAGNSDVARQYALTNLKRLHLGRSAMPSLLPCLEDPSLRVRIAACGVLWQYPEAQARVESCLLRVLDSHDESMLLLAFAVIIDSGIDAKAVAAKLISLHSSLSNRPKISIYLLYTLRKIGGHQAFILSRLPDPHTVPEEKTLKYMYKKLFEQDR